LKPESLVVKWGNILITYREVKHRTHIETKHIDPYILLLKDVASAKRLIVKNKKAPGCLKWYELLKGK